MRSATDGRQLGQDPIRPPQEALLRRGKTYRTLAMSACSPGNNRAVNIIHSWPDVTAVAILGQRIDHLIARPRVLDGQHISLQPVDRLQPAARFRPCVSICTIPDQAACVLLTHGVQ